jgi:hypothetical protein
MSLNPLLRKRRGAIMLALALTSALVLCLSLPQNERWLSPGGGRDCHPELACVECHRPAAGSTRQQIQANVKYWLGQRSTGAEWHTAEISNADCLVCHQAANEIHTTHRFLEPRFAAARNAIEPHNCRGCHAEHSGKLIEMNGNYCRHCHDSLRIINDPVRPSHASLIEQQRYETCLQCHDYHGNHLHQVPHKLSDAEPLDRIQAYLNGEAIEVYGELRSPYLQTRESTP